MNLNWRRFNPWHKHAWTTVVNPQTEEVWMECACGEKMTPWPDQLQVEVTKDESGTLVRVLWSAEATEAVNDVLEKTGSSLRT